MVSEEPLEPFKQASVLETATLFPNNAIKTVISKWNIRIPTLLEGIDAAAARFQQEGDALRASVAQQSKERASLLAEKNTKERVFGRAVQENRL